MGEESRDPFLEFARHGAGGLTLDRGAALIAAGRDHARLKRCLGQLDAIADAIRLEIAKLRPGGARLQRLITHLWTDLGLRGNTEDYDDPRNSFIDDVLDRRLGIPISLSVIYVEVARRLEIPLSGVGFPGHFLMSYPSAPAVFIDPFAPQRLLTTRDCAAMLHARTGGRMQLQPDHVRAASTREILVRMLSNLEALHARRGALPEAITASTRILALAPAATQTLCNRARLNHRAGRLEHARADLLRCLELSVKADERERAQKMLQEIESARHALN